VLFTVSPFALVCFALLFPERATAQFFQQGAKLVASGAIGSAQVGNAVAVSADGNTAITGGAGDSSNSGAAWIWTRSSGVWTQQAKLVGSGAVGAANQGVSVALAADGNTAIVGGQLDNAGVGAAWVWTRNGTVWTQQGNKLVGLGAGAGGANQGFSVALSADGNTAIVGGLKDNTFAGAAWVWTRSNETWSQQGNKLVGTGASSGGGAQGYSVALSADGNTAIVGGTFDNQNAGAVWVWVRSGSTWTQQGAKLVGSGASGPAQQGSSVAISADGNTILVGGRDDGTVGAAWVWTRSGTLWAQQGAKLVGPGAIGSSVQGDSVSLSSDGNTAIIGGPGDTSNAGAAWIWSRSGGVWTPQPGKIFGSGATGSSTQGASVALSGEGRTAIIGGPLDNSKAGAVWVFTQPSPLRHRAASH
jgi:hypothetical protein